MGRVSNEIEDEVLPSDMGAAQLNYESYEGSTSVVLKKGPWTSTEDDILVDYVNKHGEGNWNAVQKHTGLLRCGKSCRLRWANHLRPNLKKGAFTAEEERFIAELHAKMGNKWARMAAHLPGRTDNEIKNYWNTRIKRRQRAGLPLYPPEVCLQGFQESQRNQSNGGLNGGNKMHLDMLQKNSYEIHGAIFDSLKDNQGILPCAPKFSDISVCGNVLKGLDSSSQYCSVMAPASAKNKRLRESTIPFNGSNDTKKNGLYPFCQNRDINSDKIVQSYGLPALLDPGPSSHNSLCYSHSLSNGNSSTSKPTFEAVKLELPSLQYPELLHAGSWGTSPPPPLLESVDDFFQSPTPISTLESDCSSPQNSGLLDALLHQAKTLSSSRNHCSDKSSNSSTATPGDRGDSSALNVYETEWEDYADPVSPFGATSILNECPALGGSENSLDEQLSLQTFTGNIPKLEFVDQVWTPDNENQTLSFLNITRPDLLFASDWHDLGLGHDMNKPITTDTTMTLLGDFAADHKHMTSGTSQSSQVWGFGSCATAANNIHALCQLSDLG